MALDAAMVRARSARIGMLAEAKGAIMAYCCCPWGWRSLEKGLFLAGWKARNPLHDEFEIALDRREVGASLICLAQG
jgi:hypothetical protein